MRHARPFFYWCACWSAAILAASVRSTLMVFALRAQAGRMPALHSGHSESLKHSARINVRNSGGVRAVALVIYTKPGCPYCQQAREYYNSKGLTFIDRDAQTNKEFRAQMFKYSGGDPTVPCIVKDGKYVQSGWGDPLRG